MCLNSESNGPNDQSLSNRDSENIPFDGVYFTGNSAHSSDPL